MNNAELLRTLEGCLTKRVYDVVWFLHGRMAVYALRQAGKADTIQFADALKDYGKAESAESGPV